ncbi:sulfurtransferase [Chitinibacteraceae bacterium HSL-7]
MHPLISADHLARLLDQPDVRIVDCRHDLADVSAGARAYEQSHIAGALFMHLDDDLSSRKTGLNGRHPLPDAGALMDRLGALGIDTRTHVVAYDAAGGAMAARLWWLLGWLGHDRVQVLDGGWQGWQAADLPVERGAPVPVATSYQGQPDASRVVTVDEVLANLESAAFTLVDARSPQRFGGEGETMDPVAGHIPGAYNRFFMDNLQDGRFKAAERLREEWLALAGGLALEHCVHQCGSGVTACHNQLALAVAGLPVGRLYAGSWSEWCSDPARPVAR